MKKTRNSAEVHQRAIFSLLNSLFFPHGRWVYGSVACCLTAGQKSLPHRLCSLYQCSFAARAGTGRYSDHLLQDRTITCCTRCKIMTYMTIKEHAICILAVRLMFIAWCCSLRAREIALGLLALQLQSAPVAEQVFRLLLLLVPLNWWLSSEASVRAHTLWPELQRYRGHSNNRHPAAPASADCSIIHAAALHTCPLYSSVLHRWGHHARDIKTLCLDSRCSEHCCVLHIYNVRL